MFSRRMIWLMGAAVLGVLAMTWWAGDYPAQVTIMNTSGAPLQKVTISTGDQQIEIGSIANGEVRRFSLRPGDHVIVRCGGKTWQSKEPLTPAQSVVLYVLPGGRFEERSRLGTLAR